MTDSSIHYAKSYTAFDGPDAVAVFRAAAIASGLSLYANTGMKPNRMWTITNMLNAASAITGKAYKRGDAAKASNDVRLWVQEMKAALPITVDKDAPL